MKTATYGVAGIALIAVGVGLFRPVQAQSKPAQATMNVVKSAADAKSAQLERLWTPVDLAINRGDVNGVRAAFGTYLKSVSSLPYPYNSTYNANATVGMFFLRHGALQDAQALLTPLVNPFFNGKVRPLGPRDAELFCDWKRAAANAPASVTEPIVKRWYANCGAYASSPVLAQEFTPESMTEYEAGQYCLGNKDLRQEAVEHFRRAMEISPSSLHAAKQLQLALRMTGSFEASKRVALRAASLAPNPKEQRNILSRAGLNPGDLKQPGSSDQ